ncbi:6798_t:CDS:2 [Acaulospora morrowiae]|uniref:6798_t:CDS:1 n=1 Tax=Acaulospora morrowiae TaxID=94023 RepID=A0A9N8Z6K0_9GLOM|nr:6798_t:CDS:2 [Acaulospora morrowiae]
MKPKSTFESILRSTKHDEFNDDYEEIILESGTPTSFCDFTYENINAPRFRDFLNDMTLGEGDSWFDDENNAIELSPTPTEVSILDFDEKKTTEMRSTETVECSPLPNNLGFCRTVLQNKCDDLKKTGDISKPKAIRIKVDKSDDLVKGKESHVAKSDTKSQRVAGKNSGIKKNPILKELSVSNLVSKVTMNDESQTRANKEVVSQRNLEKNTDTTGNLVSKAPVASVTASKKIIDRTQMIRGTEVNRTAKDPVIGVTSKLGMSPLVRHVIVSKELDLSNRLDPPKRNKNYPKSRSPGIKKRQPTKKFRAELTVPKPFTFRTISHVHMNERRPTRSPFIPLAERVKHFLEDTPERFRTKLVSFKPTSNTHTRLLTVPKSPYLRTKQRANACRAINAEGQESDKNPRTMLNNHGHNGKRVGPTARKANIMMSRSPPTTKSQHHQFSPHKVKLHPVPHSKESHKLVGSSGETKENGTNIRQHSQERGRVCKAKTQPNEKYQQDTHQKFIKKEKHEKENVKLHAKAATKKSEKPLTEPISFIFQTDSRIQLRKAREQNDESLKKKKSKEEIKGQQKTQHLRTELTYKNWVSSKASPPNTKTAKAKFF